MSSVVVRGLGSVSPAGWGVPALRAALNAGQPLPTTPVARPGWTKPLLTRQVPQPAARLPFLAHPRLRRASLIAQHSVAAALEALGDDAAEVQKGSLRLGVVMCLMAGCVTYSRRFCEEIFKDPATASPLIFPETVFNAPASHLAAYLGSKGINYTLVGDEGMFVQGLAIAAGWLLDGVADGCVVIGGEELDWIVADAMRLFQRKSIHSSGAGAVYLKRKGRREVTSAQLQHPDFETQTGQTMLPSPASDCEVELACVTDSFPFTSHRERVAATKKMKSQLLRAQPGAVDMNHEELLCMGTQGLSRDDAAELAAWEDWSGPRLTPREILGEAFAASAAWQCVAVCDALQRGDRSAGNVSVVGANQQVIGARFVLGSRQVTPGSSARPKQERLEVQRA